MVLMVIVVGSGFYNSWVLVISDYQWSCIVFYDTVVMI